MKLIKNTGNDRVVDELRHSLTPPCSLDIASPGFSLFAFAELRDLLEKLDSCRMVLGLNGQDLGLTGSETDRAFRNRLNVHWLARECAAWARKKVGVRAAPGALPQSMLIAGKLDDGQLRAITGNCSFSQGSLRRSIDDLVRHGLIERGAGGHFYIIALGRRAGEGGAVEVESLLRAIECLRALRAEGRVDPAQHEFTLRPSHPIHLEVRAAAWLTQRGDCLCYSPHITRRKPLRLAEITGYNLREECGECISMS
jgi:hypothetical protein